MHLKSLRWKPDPRGLLAHAASLVGDPQIRTRGTIGGSLAHADPAAELPAGTVALRAELRAESER
jgi:carbon-monoxide dehydrogenase medium subunit